MKEFKLFGYNLKFDDEFEIYNEYNVMYSKLIYDAQYKLHISIQESTSIEELIENTIIIVHDELSKAIYMTVENLINLGIYSVNFDEFIENYCKVFDLDKYIVKLLDEYTNIIQISKELDVYREFEKINRGRWQGGGFGLKGAIKGAVTAAALNSVNDVINNLKDMSSVNKDNAHISKLKYNLLKTYKKDFMISHSLGESIRGCLYGFLEEASYNNKIKLPDISKKEATELYNNTVLLEENESVKLQQSIKCILKYPYNPCFYEVFYSKDPRNTEIENIINYFGIGNTALCAEYKKKYLEIDLKERTFRDKTYETKDEKITSEKKYIQKIKSYANNLTLQLIQYNINLDNVDNLNKYKKSLDIIKNVNEKYELDLTTILDESILKDKEWVESSQLTEEIQFIKKVNSFTSTFDHIEKSINEYEQIEKSKKELGKSYVDEVKKERKGRIKAIVVLSLLAFAIYYFLHPGFIRTISVAFFVLVAIGNLIDIFESNKKDKDRKKEMKENYEKYRK